MEGSTPPTAFGADPDWVKTVGVVRQYGLPYPTLKDSTGGITAEFGVQGVPNTIILDRQGIVRARLQGMQDEEALRSAIRHAST